MEEAIKERIRLILGYKSSNPTRLAKECSINQKTLNNQINSDVQLSASTILLVLNTYNDISSEWLIRGEGEMLKGDSNGFLNEPINYRDSDSVSIDKEMINNRFISIVNHLLAYNVVSGKGDLAKILSISNSKFSEILNGRMNVGVDLIAMICEKYEINSNWLLTGRGSMVDCDNNKDLDQSSHSDSIPAGNQFSEITAFYERTIEKKEQKIEELTLMVGRLQHEVEMLQQDKKTALRKDDVLGAAKKTGTSDQ